VTAFSFDLTPFPGRDDGQHFTRTWMVEDQGDKKNGRDGPRTHDRVVEP
jgi:hypothetical protein